jgi:lipopolysaccharide export system protein LptA
MLPSLVAGYALNEGAGTTTADSSGNGNVGTVSNAAWTTGKYGNALKFTGANNSFVTIKDASSIDLTKGLTLEAWVNPSTLAHSASSDWVAAVSKDNTASTANDISYALYAADGTNAPPALHLLLGGSDVGVEGTSVLSLNTWTFLSGTYDGSTMRLYVNGTQVASKSRSGTITTTTDPLHIGGDWDSEMFTGVIDNVRIYNTALTQAQIQTDENTGISSLTLSPTTLAADTIAVPYSQTITTSNGTGTVSLAVSNIQNAIPGLTVPSSGTNTLAIGGTPTATGTETFTVTATDQAGGTATANYTITVNPAVTLGPSSLPADTVQVAYSQTITAGNGTGNKSLVVSNIQNAIAGLTVPSSGTNTLAIGGTPTATGTETFTVTATDQAGGTATANYTITVNPAVTLGPSSLPADTVQIAYSQTIAASNGTGTISLAVSNVKNPIAGLTVPSSGVTTLTIGGTPTAAGTETFTVTATDQAGGTATANYSITVNPAITLSPLTLAPGTAQSVFKQTIRASGGTGTVTLVVSNVQNPVPGLNVPGSDTTELNIGGTPTAPGTETFTVTATDQLGSATAVNYSVTIDPPVVVTPATLPTGTVNDPYSFAFAASGGSGTYSFSEVGTLPSGLSLSSGGVLSGTPMQSGTFNITVTATDSNGGSASLAFTFSVNPAVVPAPATLASATLNAPYSVTFTATGGSGSGYAFAESGALPAGMTFTSAGLLSGTPTQSGSFVITVTATDSNGGTGNITDTLIAGTGTAPTVAITSPAGNSQDAGSITISATAYSGAGVKNVQFAVHGNNIGSAVPTAPYQVAWDSTQVADGYYALTATVTDNNGNTATSSITVQIVNGGVFGPVINMPDNPVTGDPVVPVNMVLLDDGSILFWDGGPDCLGAISPTMWNPETGDFTAVPLELQQEVRDIFCSDMTVLANGDVVVAGGHDCTSTTYIGTNIANIFNPSTGKWTFSPNMSDRRWYPNALTLPDGRVLVTAGAATSNTNYDPIPEVYDPVANTWTRLTNANLTVPDYPFMFALPNGNVLAAGSDESPMATYELNVATQTWTTVNSTVLDAGSAVQYLPGKIMKAGSSYLSALPDNGGGTPSKATTYVLDMTQPTPAWVQTASMAYPRTHLNLTILPDDTVLATGGSTDIGGVNPANAVYASELWSPVTQTWTTMASEQVPRLYHSTALLLPTGQVVVAGGGRNFYNNIAYPNAEIYSPAYLFKGARPTITQAPPTNLGYNQNFFIGTPDAADIVSVALIRNGSDTHAFNTDQSYVPLTFTQTVGGLTVQSPANADLAVPGYYMLFIVNKNGVPSVAPMVRLPAPYEDTQPPTAPSNLAATGGVGNVQLTWTASTDSVGVTQYNIYRSTVSGFTPSASTLIGTSATTSYTDVVAPGIYYYLVTAQNAVDHVSLPSNQAGATSLSDIRLIQDATNGSESSLAKLSVAFSSANTAGDFLIVTGAAARPRSPLTISDTAGDTFVSALGPVSDPSQDVTTYIWYAANAKGGANTVTITPTGGADALELHVSEWSGINNAAPLDQTSSATGSGTAISSGAQTTTQNGELIYGYTFPNGNSSPGSGFTGLTLVDGDWDEYQIQPVAGSVAGSFTQQPSTNWFAAMATFKPIIAGVQPPSAPGNLTATGNIGSVGLTWTASTSSVGISAYNVYRSVTSGFTPSAANLIGTTSATSYTDDIAPGTYYYVVVAQDVVGNVSAPSNQASGTSQPDTIPPTVSMIAPGNGSTVFGTLGVSATASDNVAVASVQFVLDGSNYGSPITTAPYAFSWNSATVSNGTHTWAATATDTSGNKATSAAVSFTVNNNDPAGLVAAYGMDEGAGTLVEDSSVNANNGTVGNATWTTGYYGNALQFTGVSGSNATIKDSSTLDLTKGLTLEAWVNPSTLANPASNDWVAAVAKDNTASTANDISYALYAADGTNAPPALHLLLGSDVGVQGASVLPLNTWTFLTGTYDGSTMKVYVNGTLVGSKSVSGTITTTKDALHIGGDWDSEMFTGIVDNVRIYNIALTQAQIQTDMTTAISAQPMLLQASFPAPGAAPISPAVLAPVVNEAISLWQTAGISSNDVELLREATIKLTNLPTPYLGLTSGLQVWISQNADGYGWSANPNPAVPPVSGKLDLLTVVAHEMGHVLGFPDHDKHDLMDYYLTPGERFLPEGLNLGANDAGPGAAEDLAALGDVPAAVAPVTPTLAAPGLPQPHAGPAVATLRPALGAGLTRAVSLDLAWSLQIQPAAAPAPSQGLDSPVTDGTNSPLAEGPDGANPPGRNPGPVAAQDEEGLPYQASDSGGGRLLADPGSDLGGADVRDKNQDGNLS